MSAIQWARTVRCDWPGCTRQGEVELTETWPDRVLPPGWVDLRSKLLTLLDPCGTALAEFCPEHGSESVRSMTAVMPDPKARARGDS